ncbi:MAG TPA: type VI secretion system membrane subunit TssM [Albitalea sp.]|uniref:type VI secretion system membrane subunit TssM n=1 Tax=Piscinibacter sp. TaxID=1903157 RepID=UPI002ED6218A
MIKRLLGIVFNRWVLLAVLLLAIALVIWIVGPLVAIAEARPLETESSRWIAIGLIAVLVVATALWKSWRARRGNAAVVNQLMASAPAGQKAAESPDMVAVRQRFEQAMQTLRRARFGAGGMLAGWSARLGGRYLYELPWYLIIGAPGSGKTTALHNCGLKFPLADAVGDHAVHGVGGTRNCDWWFTDQAVLIDTAGRFTTQDSDRENDRATWGGFLGMLKKSRPRQPVNGVLVTVSVTDLLTRGPAERRQHAATVRKRLQELHEHLGIRFPIYLMVTKSDLMAGFMDYFSTLDKEQRATPWGATFPLKDNMAQRLQRFGQEFDALHKRLNDGLIDRLQAERDPQRRARIYGFGGQFAGLRGVLQEFMETVFSPSPYEAEPLLRGVYFVSGTQEGTPIDRVLGSIARSYRIERAVIAPNQASGKSYFLSRLLGEVVFAEAGIAGTNLKWERRRLLLALGGYAAVALVTVGAIGAWTLSYVNNRRYVDDVAQRVDQVRALVQSTPNRASPDILPVVPALAATRSLAGTGESVPWSLGFGLYQGPKLDSAAHTAYGRMLVDAVLPRIGLRVEEQLRQAGVAPDSQYEALKAYLMLHDVQHFDADSLKAYVEADWDAQLQRSIDAEQRAQLSEHLDALLAQGAAVSPLPEDKTLIDFHRARLATVTLPQRIYNRMRHQGLGSEFPEFTVVRAAGNNAALVFKRVSGAPLTRGVPGLFSYDGYHRGFQKEVARVAQQLAEEQAWVLGIAETPKDAAATVRANEPLLDDVRRIYLNEYAATWDAFIADVRLLDMTTLTQSIQMARLLSAPDSPLPPLMKAMSRETTLLASSGKNVIEKASDKASDFLKKQRDSLADALASKKGDTGQRIESLVDDRFVGLRRLVTAPEGGKPPLDDTIALIGEVHVLLNAVDNAVKGGAAPPASPLPVKVKAEAARLPEPVRSMMDNLSQNSAQVSLILVRQNLGQEVKSQVGEFCQQAVAGRYPLDRGSARDATPADFALLFGPGGKIDQVFQQKLAAYVDTSARPWRFRAVDGVPLGADHGSLPQFQRAQAIRETFFPAGNMPSLRLQFKPIEMDATLKQFVLDVDGQVVRYDHGPQIPVSVQWPGPRGALQVRVQVVPPGNGTTGLVHEGPWALLRLFDRVRIDPTNVPERFRATFDVDGRKAVFEVTASSVRNPFRLRELNEFACPSGL